METSKKFFILEKKELLSIPGNGHPKKLFIFQEMELSISKLKRLLIFLEGISKA